MTSGGEAFEYINDATPDPAHAMERKERFEEVLRFLDRLLRTSAKSFDSSFKEISATRRYPRSLASVSAMLAF